MKLIPWGSWLGEGVEGEAAQGRKGPVFSLDMYQAAQPRTWDRTPLCLCFHVCM